MLLLDLGIFFSPSLFVEISVNSWPIFKRFIGFVAKSSLAP